jgi:pre-rRNA-processing protein TSR4
MAPYDSDSSGGEDGDYTETSVLLGYASKEPSDSDTISHLGGRPVCPKPSIRFVLFSFIFSRESRS